MFVLGNLISILVIVLATIIGYGIPGIVNKINDERLILDSYDFIQEQKAFLLGNPEAFLGAFLNALHEYKYFYMNSFVGCLGTLDTNYPTPVSASILCVLLVISIYDSIRVEGINWKIKLVDFILIVTSFLGSFLYIYITWTPTVLGVGANFISGVQGRYFIPIYLFFAVLFASNLPKKEFRCRSITFTFIIQTSRRRTRSFQPWNPASRWRSFDRLSKRTSLFPLALPTRLQARLPGLLVWASFRAFIPVFP